MTYTPNANYNGADSFTFKAYDGKVWSSVAKVSITVTPVNDPPVAQNQSVTTNEDTAKAITLAATDLDGDSLTYTDRFTASSRDADRYGGQSDLHAGTQL